MQVEDSTENFARDVPIWLDMLPRDICERIAASISGSKYENRLYLAMTSNKQRCAVLASLSYTLQLELSKEQCMQVRHWGDVFGREIVKLNMQQVRRFETRQLRSCGARRLLLSPALRSANVTFTTENVLALSHAPLLRELHLSLGFGLPRDDEMELLCYMLRTVKLSKLTMKCFRCPYPCKILEHLYTTLSNDSDFLRELQEFSLHCAEVPLYFAFATALPNLRVLSINNIQVPEQYLSKVCNLEQIHLTAPRNPIREISRIGRAVKSFTTTSPLDSEKVLALGVSPFLTKMNIAVLPGAEVALEQLRFDLLEHLTIRWHHPEHDRENIFEDIRQFFDQDQYEAMRYYMPKPGVIKNMVLNFPALRKLTLLRMRIAMTELSQLLCSLGNRLEEFEASVVDQDEAPQERVAMMMEAVGRYNRSIRRFEVNELAVARRLTPTKADELGLRLEAAFSFLRSRAPFCETDILQKYMQAERNERARIHYNA